MDDRKSKLQRDEREKEIRDARAAAAAARAAQEQTAPVVSTPSPPSASDRMPGAGHVLGVTKEDPPAYHEDDSEDSE